MQVDDRTKRLPSRLAKVLCVWIAFTVVVFFVERAPAQFSTIMNIPPDPNIEDNGGIGSGTLLNLFDGGTVGESFEVGNTDGSSTNVEMNVFGGVVANALHANGGSVVNVLGGEMGAQSSAMGALVNVAGGSVGIQFQALVGSTVNVAAGSVGSFFMAGQGSFVNLAGGLIGTGFMARDGSAVNITGGLMGAFVRADDGSVVNISGGTMGHSADFSTGSEINIRGGEFRLDGVLIGGLANVGESAGVNIPEGSVLSGTLEDGTPFALGQLNFDFIDDGTITLHAAALPPVGPGQINFPGDESPLGIRTGQAVNVGAGGTLGLFNGTFNAGRGSTVNVNGGEVSSAIEAVTATLNVYDGIVQQVTALEGTVVNVVGGSVGFGFKAQDSRLNLSGGTVGSIELLGDTKLQMTAGEIFGTFATPAVLAQGGTELTVTGGTIGGRFVLAAPLDDPAEATISGGLFEDALLIQAGSGLHLIGSEFTLNGVDITGLSFGEAFVVEDRNVTLSATLLDGTPLDLDLNTALVFGMDFIADDAIVSVTLLVPGDFDLDGNVGLEDFAILKDNFGLTPAELAQGDANLDRSVDLADFNILKENFGAGGQADVPEPTSIALALTGFVSLVLWRIQTRKTIRCRWRPNSFSMTVRQF
jgi:hypothetical protein